MLRTAATMIAIATIAQMINISDRPSTMAADAVIFRFLDISAPSRQPGAIARGPSTGPLALFPTAKPAGVQPYAKHAGAQQRRVTNERWRQAKLTVRQFCKRGCRGTRND